jgi:beta-glucosidase
MHIQTPTGVRALGAAALYALVAAGAAPAQTSLRCVDVTVPPSDPGFPAWCDPAKPPETRAGLLLGALSMDEKVSLLAGDDLFGVSGGASSHTGTSSGIPRVYLPTVYYSDGPMGSRQGAATAMPAPIALAAAWDRDLAYLYGKTVANEVRNKGNDVVFAPTVNIMRTPLGGRGFEGYGEDPYLVAETAVAWIRGAQDEGVIGCIKHYAVNNQEGLGPAVPGAPLGVALLGDRYTVDAVVDERTLREIYLPAFEAAVAKAGVGSVMCAYNRVNGQYACESRDLLEEILRGDWGFDGYVLSDYGAAHPQGTAASLNAGLDFEPWPGWSYSPLQVNLALAASEVSTSTIDDRVRAVLRTLFAFGVFDRPGYRNDDGQIDKAGHAAIAADVERSAITLLQNDGVLPLDAALLDSVAVIGSEANRFQKRTGSAGITPFSSVTPYQSIRERGDEEGFEAVLYDRDDPAGAAAVARDADVALVFVADWSGEGSDKPCLDIDCGFVPPRSQDEMIEAVAAANERTVVVLQTGGPVLTGGWRGDVEAILEAWVPGAGAGPAIADVLFGDADPGGRLPVTFPESEDQLPMAGDPESYPGVGERVVYKEGVLVGYRWFDERGLAPAFPFGHGLSYASFAYRNVLVAPAGDGATVDLDVENVGSRRGSEVVQVYVSLPDASPSVTEPPLALAGFEKVTIDPGSEHAAHVHIALDVRAFSYWDTPARGWRIPHGCAEVFVAHSSRDKVLAGVIPLGEASCPD